MKDLFISDLKEHIGKEICIQVLLKDINLSENAQKNKWQEMLVSDKTGELSLRAWGEQMQEAYYDFKGKVVKVMGRVHFYQGRVELQIIAMDIAEDYEWTDYVLSLDSNKAKDYIKRFSELMRMVADQPLKKLLEKIYDVYRINKMATAVGGIMHHHYFGGLLVHTVETAIAAMNLAEIRMRSISPYAKPVNKDLVLAGALLHDVGKLNSYGGFPDGELTTRGLLVNSCVESVLFATMYNSQLPKDKQVKDLGQLDHILLTAETMDECGTYPRTIEAVIVNEANRESVKMDGFDMVFNDYDRRSDDNRQRLYSKINGTTILRGVM